MIEFSRSAILGILHTEYIKFKFHIKTHFNKHFSFEMLTYGTDGWNIAPKHQTIQLFVNGMNMKLLFSGINKKYGPFCVIIISHQYGL